MDPRGAPDFGGNWTTVRNEGSNTWGRKWTGAQDHEEGKKTWRGFNKPSETARDRTNTTVDQQIFEESIEDQAAAEAKADQSEFNYDKGGLIGKPKKKKNKSYKKGGYVTSKKTKQRENGLASRP
jgi:hypothetical protein